MTKLYATRFHSTVSSRWWVTLKQAWDTVLFAGTSSALSRSPVVLRDTNYSEEHDAISEHLFANAPMFNRANNVFSSAAVSQSAKELAAIMSGRTIRKTHRITSHYTPHR